MGKHILVVDDTVSLLTQIVEVLKMEGYFITSASNGHAGLMLLKKIKPDCIITDLLMPKMDGFEFITRIRSNLAWNHIPIMVFSAMPAHENEERILALGANLYLKKPSMLETLVTTVHNLLEHEK